MASYTYNGPTYIPGKNGNPSPGYTGPIGPGMGHWGPQDVYDPRKSGTTSGSSSNRSSGRSSGRSSSSRSSNTTNSAQAAADAARKKLQSQIGSGWDSYINSLNDQFSGLDSQRAAQEGLVNSQYNQGVNNLGLQYNQGNQSLDKNREQALQNQTSNLRDISSNIRNAFQAGNVYLGSRGAGDSSAANQYSYALNKMGTQQRSGVMNNTANILGDVEARRTNLKNMYDTETNNLSQQKNAQMQQVALWFSEAQNKIRQMQAEGKLNKAQDMANLSRDLYNQAISKVQQIEQYNMQRRQALDQWAMGMSENIQQLASNMQGVSNIQGFEQNLPQAQAFNGGPTIDSSGDIQFGYGGGGYGGGYSGRDNTDQNNLFSGYPNNFS